MKAVVDNVEIVEDGLHSLDVREVLGNQDFFGFAADVSRKSDDAFIHGTEYRRASEGVFALKNLLDFALDLYVRWGWILVSPHTPIS